MKKKISYLKLLIIFLIVFFPKLTTAQSDSLLTFSEIMFNAVSGNNEFIEIYNTSETQSINLNNIRIKYYTSTPDTIKNAGYGTILPPKSYAVIFEGDYDIPTGIYNQLIPSSALILKIADNAFGSSGMANTTDRQLWLINTTGDTLETYTYTANNNTAYSDEKIILYKNNSTANWGNGLTYNGTPGFRNTLTPLNYDLLISSVSVTPLNPLQGQTVTISAKVKNKGVNTAATYQAEFYNDLNFDSIPTVNELLSTQNLVNLLAGDSINFSTQFGPLNAGNYRIIAKVNFSQDEDTTNNKIVFDFTVYSQGNNYNDIVINEIMYAPSTGEPEWVEVYNRTANVINLKKWKFADNSTTVTITSNNVFIQPNSFVVLSKDSSVLSYYSVPVPVIVFSLPALNNTDDACVLKDSLGNLIDSLYYYSSWGGASGKSLERIDVNSSSTNSSNWKTSTNIYKATPGRINSVTQKNYDVTLKDIVFNPAFPVSGDNVTVSALIKNTGKNSASFYTELWEDTNLDSLPDVLVASSNTLTLAAGDSLQHQFSYIINNITNTKGFVAFAVYTQDEDTTDNRLYKLVATGYPKSSIVINEIMYAPQGGEPEWIELYNTTSDSINLSNWTITDVYATPITAKINQQVYIKANEFLVIAKDSTIKNFHRSIPSRFIVVSMPSFNNDVDGVVLKDNRSAVIDSVLYYNTWGGTGGYSLERKVVSASSNIQSNWSSSTDIEQSTPGRTNSISPKNYDLTISELSFIPPFPVPGDNVYISVKIKNNGLLQATNFSLNILIDSDNNNSVDSLLEIRNNLSLAVSDSLIITSTAYIKNITSKILVAARVDFTLDEDIFNNYMEKSVEPGYASKIILVNEFMYDPVNNEPEWVEIQNVSTQNINLKNWMISDLLTTPVKAYISTQDLILLPNEFLVIARDSSYKNYHQTTNYKFSAAPFGTLNNTGDGVYIYDFRGAIIDSINYKSSWGGSNGVSLERISKQNYSNDNFNWTSSLSLSRSTPGEENSVNSIPSYKIKDIVINEIMFDPATGNNEFIEFYNSGNDSVNLGGWKFYDEKGNYFRLFEIGFVLPPKTYFVYAADSSVIKNYSYLEQYEYKNIANESNLGFTNTGELILLKDVHNNTIDSVFYSDNWHNPAISNTKNKSLERINPFLGSNDAMNWSTCVLSQGASPGKANSIYTTNPNLQSSISISPNPFSPDNDGFEDFTLINYNLSQPVSQIKLKIFDSKGRLVRNLANNVSSGSKGQIIFNGLDDDGNPLRIGIYIVYLEAVGSSGSTEKQKAVLVVARKL